MEMIANSIFPMDSFSRRHFTGFPLFLYLMAYGFSFQPIACLLNSQTFKRQNYDGKQNVGLIIYRKP